jgi:hypothetical protein
MNYSAEHLLWTEQVEKLRNSVSNLSMTEPKNVLQHFFLQALDKELSNSPERVQVLAKSIVCKALELMNTISGTIRQQSAIILRHFIQTPVLNNIQLVDIRNIAVFEIYQRCGQTTDTYFDRYSSPPGSAEQISAYIHIAHGPASASAEETITLSSILLYMQILKRFFVVNNIVNSVESVPSVITLNWLGAMWGAHVKEKSLGDLVWELFLDVWHYENPIGQ